MNSNSDLPDAKMSDFPLITYIKKALINVSCIRLKDLNITRKRRVMLMNMYVMLKQNGEWLNAKEKLAKSCLQIKKEVYNYALHISN